MSEAAGVDGFGSLVDRGVARLGGRAVIAHGRGMGYFCIEVIPVSVWSQVTGAVSQQFFYFVAYLQLVGASDVQLAWLPLTCAAAGVGQCLLVLRRRPGHAKRRCVVECWVGRSAWLGTILWPLAGLWLGWSVPVMLGGVLACVFTTHLLSAAANASFVTWTQAKVPPPLRGAFYAWRNVASYFTAGVVMLIIALIYPGHADRHVQLSWLMAVMAAATLSGIGSTWLLSRAPDVPEAERLPTYGPLSTHLTGNRALRPFLAWSFLTAAAAGVSLVFQSLVYLDCGVTSGVMAFRQALALYPCMLIAIAISGWLLPRLHGQRLLLIAHVLTIISEAALLTLTPARLSWLLPLVLGLFGLAQGALSVGLIGRIQELIPRGDPRIYALYLGLSNAAALLATLMLPWLTLHLGRWASQHPALLHSAPWAMVAIGIALRVIATPFLLGSSAAPGSPAPADAAPPSAA